MHRRSLARLRFAEPVRERRTRPIGIVDPCHPELLRNGELPPYSPPRFVEIVDGRLHDLGVEVGLSEDFPLDLQDGEAKSVLGEDGGTQLQVPPLIPGATDGLRLNFLGLLRQPRFQVLLRALESSEVAEVLSAPAITTLNNSRATIAITRNLPFLEDYTRGWTGGRVMFSLLRTRRD